MKTILVLTASIVLVSILFCSMVMAAPSMPADLQIVQPDPSLPKELSAFFGNWEGSGTSPYFLIVEKIDEEKASLYILAIVSTESIAAPFWMRYEAQVMKERGKYKVWYSGPFGNVELTLKGESLNYDSRTSSRRLKRVP